MTLWLDSGKSYRSRVASLKHALPAQYDCIASRHVDDTQRAMLQYFGNITTRRHAHGACGLLLVRGNRMTQSAEDETEWKQIWEGGRSSDRNERFRLYRRIEK